MERAPLRSFTELVAWQKARAVRKAISELVRAWPSEEKFRLVDQIIRSSRGPCANIAEGYGRYHEKDNVRFCRMGRSSLHETQDHLTAAYDEGYITGAVLKVQWALIEEALRVLNGYIAYLLRMGSTGAVAEPETPYGPEMAIFGPAPVDLGAEDGAMPPDGKPTTTTSAPSDNRQPTTDN